MTDSTGVRHTPGKWTVTLIKGSYQRPAIVKSGDKMEDEPAIATARAALGASHDD